MFCSSLFVLMSFFFWPLDCLSFDLRILITPLVSSNSSNSCLRYYFNKCKRATPNAPYDQEGISIRNLERRKHENRLPLLALLYLGKGTNYNRSVQNTTVKNFMRNGNEFILIGPKIKKKLSLCALVRVGYLFPIFLS